MVHVGIGFYCLGAHANVGPLVLGARAYGGPHDKRAGLSCLGPGGISLRSMEGGVIGVGIPLRLADVPAKRGSQALGDRKQPPQCGDTWPPWGSVGAEVFLLLYSLSVRFDVVECADFAAGLLFLDPAGDDLGTWPEEKSEPVPDEVLAEDQLRIIGPPSSGG